MNSPTENEPAERVGVPDRGANARPARAKAAPRRGENTEEELGMSGDAAQATLPPLVEPAAELTKEEVARYSRHLIIPDVGMAGQKRLKNARVLIIGAGGLGSPAMLYLAAAGVGTIGIVEFDHVDESNLHRQVIHGQSDLGRPKAESARDSIAEINPFVQVNLHQVHLSSDNALDIFADYDLILDGTDNFATRYLVNDAAVLADAPPDAAAGRGGGDGDAGGGVFADGGGGGGGGGVEDDVAEVRRRPRVIDVLGAVDQGPAR